MTRRAFLTVAAAASLVGAAAACVPGTASRSPIASAEISMPPASPSATITGAPPLATRTTTGTIIDPGDVAPEEPLELLWQASEPGDDLVPFHPAIDPDGRIWTPLAGENTFAIFDRDGEFIELWGEPGSGEGQFNFISQYSNMFGGIAFAGDGSFYVSESGNRRVQKFDADRNFVLSWGGFGTADSQFLTPNAIALDGSGNVYIHDDELTVHKMFTGAGEFVRVIAFGSSPFVATSEAGYVYAQMLSTNLLNEYAPDGRLARSIDLSGLASLPRVADVKIDGEGRIWVSSVMEQGPRDIPDKLFVLSPEGRLLHRWDGMAVTQFAIDPEGDQLYATFFGQPFLAAYAIPED